MRGLCLVLCESEFASNWRRAVGSICFSPFIFGFYVGFSWVFFMRVLFASICELFGFFGGSILGVMRVSCVFRSCSMWVLFCSYLGFYVGVLFGLYLGSVFCLLLVSMPFLIWFRLGVYFVSYVGLAWV